VEAVAAFHVPPATLEASAALRLTPAGYGAPLYAWRRDALNVPSPHHCPYLEQGKAPLSANSTRDDAS